MQITFFYVLWERPLVCVISSGLTLRSGVDLALAYAAGRPCKILARPTWNLFDVSGDIAAVDRWLRRHHPHARLVSMAGTESDATLMAGLGVEAIHAHNSAFIDERIFYPEPGATKLFDAVHNAQTKAFKRHELAYGVRNLALITYAQSGASETVADLVQRYRDLRYVNYSERVGYQMLDGDQIRRVVSQARCGLVLSEVEGPNNASMEYFLCGVPLVTTPSRGGREAMYDPRHVAIVEPTPQAVEAAVAAFAASAPDPQEIRQSALARARPHRERLITWLSGIVGEDLFKQADKNLRLPQFCDKLRKTWRLEPQPNGCFEAHQIEGWARPSL